MQPQSLPALSLAAAQLGSPLVPCGKWFPLFQRIPARLQLVRKHDAIHLVFVR